MSNPIGEFVPDPLAPSGYRWKRHDEPEPTGLLPIVETPMQLPAVNPSPRDEQEDLSHLDEAAGPLVNTDKLADVDEVLVQPPQAPDWIPEGAP
ncbi:MAG TPA: hypothetical protein VKZ89_00055 [Thermobifida alba]|nr:hypothetical protein [Thermobifida alba]